MIPTKGEGGEKLRWTVFSFGSSVPAFNRSPFLHFFDAMVALDTQNWVAIRIDNGETKYMLVRQRQQEKILFSVKEQDNEDVMTKSLDGTEDEDRISLLRFVRENLESGE
jgi:hypothetical protein